jgi:proteasome alpha subunit
LGSVGGNGAARELPATQLEVAVLDRTRANRKFRRYVGPALTALLPTATAEQPAAPAPADTPPHDVGLDQPADRAPGDISD